MDEIRKLLEQHGLVMALVILNILTVVILGFLFGPVFFRKLRRLTRGFRHR